MKKNAEKPRIIHDLSWPPGQSINDFISAQDSTLTYVTVDYAANLTCLYKQPWLVKIDLKSAFLSCPVLPQDSHFLGFTWPNADGVNLAYKFKVLPFGLKTSPRAFDCLSSALQYIMINRGASPSLIHYLDDFLGVAGSETDALSTLNIMLDTCRAAGFQVQSKKTLGPARSIEFLGVTVDTVENQLRIPEYRMREISELVREWIDIKVCTKRQLLSLIGKLSFSARVVRAGQKFIRRLILLSKKAQNLHQKITLTSEAKMDLRWWCRCLESHNGISWLDDIREYSEPQYMYTDASDLAAGAIFGTSWTIREFSGEHSWMATLPIVWRELYAVVLCVAVFGHSMRSSFIKMYTDNMAAYHCINTGTSKDKDLMALLRALYFYTTIHDIYYRAYYLGTLDNAVADSLSRLDLPRFRKLCPQSDLLMTSPCDAIVDFS